MRLNAAELKALAGLDPFYWVLYIGGIKPKMDYATGLVGNLPGKNIISYQLLRERLFIEPRQGIKTPRYPSRFAILRGIKFLLKQGLIAKIPHSKKLILKCILASTDDSVQIEAARTPHIQPPSNFAHAEIAATPVASTFAPQQTPKAATKKSPKKIEVIANSATPPLIRIVNTNVLTIWSTADIEASFARVWASHPIKKRKMPCHEIYIKKKLYLLEAKIIDYILNAKARDRNWLNGYPTHPYTILKQELWTDEIEERIHASSSNHATAIFQNHYDPQSFNY